MPVSRKTHPALYRLAVAAHRLRRFFSWHLGSTAYATKQSAPLPETLFRHKSVILRELAGVDMTLQRNKAVNLAIAARAIDGVVLNPGETFSLWRLIGNPTAAKGYLPGMLLSDGEVLSGVGGGLCQMANLLYWMALHSPLEVTQHFHHSVDIFPDSGRVLPFGSGATIFYNYIDLQCKNTTSAPLQFHIWTDEKFLQGEVRSAAAYPQRFHIEERDHRYEKEGGIWHRSNELWRKTVDAATGQTVSETLLRKNHARMLYKPPSGQK